MAATAAGFLAERLAKASAVPAEQRTADVRAFIETCRLQAELAEELGLPEDVDITSERDLPDLSGRWSSAAALRFVRSHLISCGATLRQNPQLYGFAAYNLYTRTSFGATGTLPSDLGHELTVLLEGDPGLETFAILAAGLPGVKTDRGWEAGECENIIITVALNSQLPQVYLLLSECRAPEDEQQRGGAPAAASRAAPAPERACCATAATDFL